MDFQRNKMPEEVRGNPHPWGGSLVLRSFAPSVDRIVRR